MIVRQRRVVGADAPSAGAHPGSLTTDSGAPARKVEARLPISAGVLWLAALGLTLATAIGAKELGPVSPLAAIDRVPASTDVVALATPALEIEARVAARDIAVEAIPAAVIAEPARMLEGIEPDETMRWFNGRPVRPARTITMRVTAYSPDAASCYPYADGQTATLHGVDTNGGFLVAADTDLLPFGSMLSIDGYAGGDVVPVLDRGGAIKGNRLDLLFPTHEAALEWGVRDIEITVWEYADGRPADDPRKLRS